MANTRRTAKQTHDDTNKSADTTNGDDDNATKEASDDKEDGTRDDDSKLTEEASMPAGVESGIQGKPKNPNTI